jgi:cell division septation protein DedD
MPDAPQLPELARSLRSLGVHRGATAEVAHAAIFQPLLEARARAVGAQMDSVLAALRGDSLSARIEAQAVDAAVQGVEHPAIARALTAQTSELIEPLRAELLALDAAASGVARDGANGWNAWIAQLRRVFDAADVACQALSRLLANRETRSDAPRWFARSPR